jgi:membrane protease YdiL (CAAX protease family)
VLTVFFLLTYALTWTCFITAPVGSPLFYVGVFAPGIVALSMTGWTEGTEAVLALLRRLFLWDVGTRWYVFAAGYMATIKLTVALIHRIVYGVWPRFGHDAWYVMLGATILSLVIGGQAGEELGWRGYALPRLAARMGFGPASIVIGIIWATWHLPLFFTVGTDTQGQSFPLYLLEVTAISVAMTWLYAHTKGSLLLVMLMHSAVNNTKDIVPSAVPGATDSFALSTSPVAWLTAALLWICAGYFLLTMPTSPVSPRNTEASSATTASRD